MKKTALMLFVVLMILAVATDSSKAGPQMTIPEKSFDFGYVPQNSKVSHIFWIHSTGDDSLKIVNIRTG